MALNQLPRLVEEAKAGKKLVMDTGEYPDNHLFPPDREETFQKQLAFQRMYWGGPDTYTPWRGHPRMRARHLPFPIGQAEADTWMACMAEAVSASAMPSAMQPQFLARLRMIAQAMINQAE